MKPNRPKRPPMTQSVRLWAVLGLLAVASLGTAVLVEASLGGPDGTGPYNGSIRFENATASAGIDYEMVNGGISNSRSGVYVLDYNRDHYPDLLAVGGTGPVLYENTGDGFVRSGALPDLNVSVVQSVLVFDHDGDGWRDLLVVPLPEGAAGLPAEAKGEALNATAYTRADWTTPPPVYLLDNREGTFVVEQRVDVPVDDLDIREYPIGATAADADRDGDLDVFYYQSGDWRTRVPTGFQDPTSLEDAGLHEDNGGRNFLLENEEGRLDYAPDAGLAGVRWSLTASFVDFTGDGYPDIHVANDVNEDVLYVNEGDGTFSTRAVGDFTDRNGMSSEVADVNGDGRPDVFVTNIMTPQERGDAGPDTNGLQENYLYAREGGRYRGNNLLVNAGNGTFVGRATAFGVRRTPELWGWAALLADFDNDGDADLVHGNNEVNSVTEAGQLVTSLTPPAVWERGPEKFHTLDPARVGFEGHDGRGIARLDYDRDGDLDVVIADNGGRLVVYENTLEGGHSLELRVADARGDPVLGARAYVTVGNRTRVRFANARTDFLSQDSRTLHVGLGSHETATVRVVWPDGTERVFRDVAADQYLLVTPDGVAERLDYDRSSGGGDT